MDPHFLGTILAFVTNLVAIVWWASKMTAKMDTNKDTLLRIEKELEKRDGQMAAAWKKIDRHEHRLTVVETKCKINNVEPIDE